MEKARIVYKMFSLQDDSEYDGFFSIFETDQFFWGYRIEKNVPKFGVSIYLGSKRKGTHRYINCEQMYQFDKSTYYDKLETRYNLKKLRGVVDQLRTGKLHRCCISGEKYMIKDWGSITEDQLKNRRNPENHKRLKEARILRERAILQNDIKAEKDLSIVIDELNQQLGYRENAGSSKYKKQLVDSVTNLKPISGGACTPK